MSARSSVQPTNVQTATKRLRAATRKLTFSAPAAHVYRPLDYAAEAVDLYESRFGQGTKEFVLVGMNPGPFGMGQTGIPFGEVAAVRDWMRIECNIHAPATTHPKRPIEGFSCTRSEVSGQRLWGAVAERHPDPSTFFARAFVINYCPLLFLSASGANVTPDKLAREERRAFENVCDEYLRDIHAILQPRLLIGVGQYAEKRLQMLFGDRSAVACIPHPSPASPAANRGWAAQAKAALKAAGVHGLM